MKKWANYGDNEENLRAKQPFRHGAPLSADTYFEA